jgi:hypothetical protein
VPTPAGASRSGPATASRTPSTNGITDAHPTRDDRDARSGIHMGSTEAQSNQKHEQHQPELAERIQRRQRWRRKECGRRSRHQPSETRGSKHQAGDHFADDCRLSDGDEQPSREARDRQDDGNLEQ